MILSASLIGNQDFLYVNFIFSTMLLSFLVFNQRPAKIFMGDTGSLFIGYYFSFPLLYMDIVKASSSTIDMTPFILLVSFLVADTSESLLQG